MGLNDMAPNDLANLMTVGGAALCSLLMVIFKSRCTQISILWGLWKCDRTVSNDETDEEAPKAEDSNGSNGDILSPTQPLPPASNHTQPLPPASTP